MVLSVVLPVLAILGCSPDPEPPAQADPLPPAARLIRSSMILRGVRPTEDELDRVVADPGSLDEAVDAWLDDPRFGETVREIHDHAWRLSSDVLQLPASGSLTGVTASRIKGSLLSSPARLAERVVQDGLPYTETVTADWFVADAVVASAWPDVVGFDLARPDDWQRVTWGDGRPAAGVLADSALWMRYRSPNQNFNRQRANALSRALLCHDFLEGEIADADVVVDLTDVDAANEAVRTVPGCVACHQDLDTLAGFFPFEPFWAVPTMRFPYPVYDEVHETEWQRMTGRPPQYFGLGGGDLAALGRHVADDPRFSDCTARRFYGWFAQVDPEQVPFEVAAELQAVLVESGWDAKQLARAAVLHPTLGAAHAGAGRYLTASPRQLARMVEDLTGFRWEVEIDVPCCDAPAGSSAYGTVELTTDQYAGYDVVGGGFDGDAAPDPKRTPSVTAAALQRRLAEHAAAHAVAVSAPGVFGSLRPTDEDPERVRERLAALHLRLFGEVVGPDDPLVDDSFALWTSAAARGGPEHAWRVTLTAFLRDLRALTY